MDYKALRGKSPDEIIQAAAAEAGVPPQLIDNLWATESGRGQNMVSPKGAVGHGQIMPRELGVMRQRYGEDLDPHSLSDAMFMTAQMLKENLQHFGNIPDAVAAYNGGWKKENWDNAETRAYVPKVLAGTGITYAPPTPTSALNQNRAQMDASRKQAEGATSGAARKWSELTPQEQNTVQLETLNQMQTGGSPEEAIMVGTQLANNPDASLLQTMLAGQQAPVVDFNAADATIEGAVAGDIATATRIADRSNKDMFVNAFQEYSLAAPLYDMMTASEAGRLDGIHKPDSAWTQKYLENRDTYIKGLSPAAIQDMDGALNEKEALWIAEQDQESRKRQQVLNDSDHPIMWGLVGGITDPAGWAVGAGVGAAFQTGKQMALAGRVASLAAENAAANVVITGAMDSLGRQTTADDYIHAAGFGLLTGSVLGAASHVWSRADLDEIAAAAQRTHEAGAETTARDAAQAAMQNPGADAATVAQAAKDIARDRVTKVISDVQNDPAPASKVFVPERQLEPAELMATEDKMALDTVPGEEQLMSIAGLYKSADDFLAKNKAIINEARISKEKTRAISDAFGWRSASHELITDDNPLAKVLGMTVAEDAAGVSGYRGTTVSIKSKLQVNEFNHNIEHGVNENYQGWLREQKVGRIGGALETYTTGKKLQEFYTQVYEEIEFRGREGYTPSANKYVRQAANVFEQGYQKMAERQRRAKTLGHEMVPESSVGYQPHQLDPSAVRKLTANEKRQFMNELVRQAQQDFGWDTEFANKLVKEYINRAEDYALGKAGAHAPAPKGLTEVALEALNKRGLEPAEFMKELEKLRKGAARHTNKRLDWDLSQKIRLDNGTEVPLSTLYNKDILSLYKGYANRVAGDVAFAHVGIMGDRDIRLVTEALQRSKVGNAEKTIPAWQQVVNEVYNRPTALDAGGQLSTGARFIRQYTGIRLLGGVGFMQMGELSNAVAHVGLGHTMALAARIPKVWGDLKTLKAGKIPENPILSSLDMVAGSPMGADHYQMILPQVIDDGLTIVDKSSLNNVMRVMGSAQLVHNKFSFMRAVTAVEQRVVSEEIVRKAFRFMKTGQEDTALRDMGFTPELQARIKAEMDNIAIFDKKGYLQALDVTAMKDREAMEELLVAVRRGTGQIIQETFPGETGKWMRSEIGQLLMQFRKFPSVAIEKQMYRQFKNIGTARAMGGVVAAMGLGTILYSGRVQMAASLMPEAEREKYLKNRMSVAGMANGALMYVGALGMATDFMQMGSGVGGMIDDQLDLGWSGARGVQGSGIGGLIPSLGTLSEFYNYTQNPSAKGALKMLPFTNLPMVLPLINSLKHTDND